MHDTRCAGKESNCKKEKNKYAMYDEKYGKLLFL